MSIAIRQQKLFVSTALEQGRTFQFDAPTVSGNGVIFMVACGNSSQRLAASTTSSGAIMIALRDSGSLDTGGWVNSAWGLWDALGAQSFNFTMSAGYTGKWVIVGYELTGFEGEAQFVSGEAYVTAAHTTSVETSVNTTPEMQANGGMLFSSFGVANFNAAPIFTPTHGETEDADVYPASSYNFWSSRRALPSAAQLEYSGMSWASGSKASGCTVIVAAASAQEVAGRRALFMAGD